eukprot:4682474-Pyramimonas_sp.AAC.1
MVQQVALFCLAPVLLGIRSSCCEVCALSAHSGAIDFGELPPPKAPVAGFAWRPRPFRRPSHASWPHRGLHRKPQWQRLSPP